MILDYVNNWGMVRCKTMYWWRKKCGDQSRSALKEFSCFQCCDAIFNAQYVIFSTWLKLVQTRFWTVWLVRLLYFKNQQNIYVFSSLQCLFTIRDRFFHKNFCWDATLINIWRMTFHLATGNRTFAILIDCHQPRL